MRQTSAAWKRMKESARVAISGAKREAPRKGRKASCSTPTLSRAAIMTAARRTRNNAPASARGGQLCRIPTALTTEVTRAVVSAKTSPCA